MGVIQKLIAVVVSSAPFTLAATDAVARNENSFSRNGISGIWILANISYAGMRAQNSPNSGWRIISFIFGFPGTLISFLVVAEGSERAYGVDVPRRKSP